MGFKTIYNIAASAMTANRLRINTIASNLANSNTTRTAEGGPYKRRDVVFQSTNVEVPGFKKALDEASLRSVKVSAVYVDDKEPILVHNPSHPDADPESGMVKMPNINPVSEMVNLLGASNAYKAGAQITTITKQMSQALTKLAQMR